MAIQVTLISTLWKIQYIDIAPTVKNMNLEHRATRQFDTFEIKHVWYAGFFLRSFILSGIDRGQKWASILSIASPYEVGDQCITVITLPIIVVLVRHSNPNFGASNIDVRKLGSLWCKSIMLLIVINMGMYF